MTNEVIKRMSLMPDASAMLLRASLRDFIGVFHWYLTRQEFVFKEFHLRLIEELEKLVFEPDVKRPNLYIGLPPRFGKTQIAKYFAAWSYANNPQSNFIMTSYGADLVQNSSKVIRGIVDCDLFRKLFKIRVARDTSSGELWQIQGGGAFRAATLEGVITGFGAGVQSPGYGGALIIDDFLKANESHSKAAKQSVIQAYTEAIKSRLNKPGTPIIVIAQRLAVDDLIGYIDEHERNKWRFFIVKGLDENTGKAAWEERMPAAQLLEMREKTPFVYYSQYQQEPIILGGDVFKTEWWRYYRTDDRGRRYKRIFMCCDTAMKTGEQNDFTVLGVFGITYDNAIHLLDMVHGKFEAPDLERVFCTLWEKWRRGMGFGVRASAVYVEDKASGTGLIQNIRHRGVPVLPMTPTKDKYTRALETVPTIQAGLFFLPDNEFHPISRKVIMECEAFRADMSHKHDDIVDTICYAVEKAAGGSGFF